MSNREWTPERIKQLRTKLGKTQKEFAKMARVHIGTLIRWETDKFKPSLMSLERLNELYEKNR